MKKKIYKLIKRLGIDAITLGAISAIVPLIGDNLWWHRDYLLGEWTWHLAIILTCFVIATILSVISLIWYHKTKDEKYKQLEKRIKNLEQVNYITKFVSDIHTKNGTFKK